MRKQGIMICGHGSRSKHAEREFGLLATSIRKRFPKIPVEYGFLEYSAPNIHMGLDALKNLGVDNIIAVPGMLFAATHAKNDIPSVLTTYQEKNPTVQVSYGRELGLHPQMIAAFEIRILESLGLDHVHEGDLYDTMLVVVGRGTSDTYANAEVAFVGGSLVNTGGQNMLEPAALNLPIITGPYLQNFLEVRDLLLEKEALIIVSNNSELTENVIKLLGDANQRHNMGERAYNVVMANRGSSERVITMVKPYLLSL